MPDDPYIIYDNRETCQHPSCSDHQTQYVRHRSIAAGWETRVCKSHVGWAKAQQMKILRSVDR